MRRRYMVIAGTAVLALAGVAYGLFIYPDQAIRGALDEMARKMPPGDSFSYKSVHYAVLRRTLTLRGMAVHFNIPGTKPNGANIAIDSLVVVHPATDAAAAFARLQTDPASITPQTRIAIADGMVLTGVRLSADVAPLASSTGWLGVFGLSLYPWVFLHEGRPAFDKMQAALKAGQTSPEALPLLQFYAAMILGLRYDTYDERGLYVTLPGPAGTALANRPVVLGTHRLQASYKLGTQSNASLDGFIVSAAPYGALLSGHVDLPDFDIRDTLLRMIGGTALGPAAESMKIGPIRFHTVSAAPKGKAAVPLGDTLLSALRFDQGKLVSGAIAMDKFALSRSRLCAMAGGTACGDDTVPQQLGLSWRAAFSRDLARDRLAVADTGLDVDGLGHVTLDARFAGISTGPAALAHADLAVDGAPLVRLVVTLGRGSFAPWLQAAGGDAQNFRIEMAPALPVPLDTVLAGLAAPGGVPAELGLRVVGGAP